VTQPIWIYPRTVAIMQRMRRPRRRVQRWGAWRVYLEPTCCPPEGLRPAPTTWHTPDGRSIAGYPIHSDPWSVWITDGDAYPAHYPAGAAYPAAPGEPDNCVTLLVYEGDDETTLTLRLIHELLHTMGLPADDMDEHVEEFLFAPERWIYRALRHSRWWAPHTRNWFEALYYRYLLRRAAE